MTTPSTERKAGPFLGNAAQTVWPFAFKVFAATDLRVVVADGQGVETDLAYGVDYTAVLNPNQESSPGGTVAYPISGAPLATGSRLVVLGNLPYDQPLDLPGGGNFRPQALENQLDRTVMQLQPLREESSRTVRSPATSGSIVAFPTPRPNTLLGFDLLGRFTTFAVQLGTSLVDLAAAGGAAIIGAQAYAGAALRSVLARLNDAPLNVLDCGAVGDGVANDAAAIQAAIDVVSGRGAGVVLLPRRTTYNIGTTTLVMRPNVILRGEVGRYAGSTTRGVTLKYSGVSTAIHAQNCLDATIEHLDLDMTGATGTAVRGVHMNGAWKCTLRNVTARGMTVAKGYSLLWDTNEGFWGAQHNLIEMCEFPDGVVRFAGTSGGDGVTTTIVNTCRGYMYEVLHSQIILQNATAEEWPVGQFGYRFEGAGTHVTMIGCDVENTNASATAITATAPAEWREFGTIWAGYAGSNTGRVTGVSAPIRSYGGAFQFTRHNAGVSTAYDVLHIGDPNALYLTQQFIPLNVAGGDQTGYLRWQRRFGADLIADHDWQNHGFFYVVKSVSSTSATGFARVKLPSGRGLSVSVHIEGTQSGDGTYSNKREFMVRNAGGTLTIAAQPVIVAASSSMIISAVDAGGGNFEVQITPSTSNGSSVQMTIEVRGPYSGFTVL